MIENLRVRKIENMELWELEELLDTKELREKYLDIIKKYLNENGRFSGDKEEIIKKELLELLNQEN
jgi:hypothetical protein